MLKLGLRRVGVGEEGRERVRGMVGR